MEDFKELFETGLKFHGHKCPAMPMGLKAGLAAMKALGVARTGQGIVCDIRNWQRPCSRLFSGRHNDGNRLYIWEVQY